MKLIKSLRYYFLIVSTLILFPGCYYVMHYEPQSVIVKKDPGKKTILHMVELCEGRPYVFIHQDSTIWKLNKIGINEANTKLIVQVGEVTTPSVISDTTVLYTWNWPLPEKKVEKKYYELHVTVEGLFPFPDSTIEIIDENILEFRYYNPDEIANDPGFTFFILSFLWP